ncbi:hypothetical protein [Soonwooa sp.]|uniref:hypothetical protein n=1 Tax=Soonwooa sp. TaxID=1938592 RepID=UPI00260B06BA|nr:hypothetical protein [Soonwooa sp.]
MKKINTLILAAAFIGTLSNCTSKGEPNPQGQLLTTEQIKALSKDQSMNGKLVEVEGYAGICNSMFVTKGKKNEMIVYTDGFCKGEKLMDMQVNISRGDIAITGDEPRNFGSFADDKNLSNEALTFTTDDYQEVANGRLKFSGKLVYNGDNYYLENVTIHK